MFGFLTKQLEAAFVQGNPCKICIIWAISSDLGSERSPFFDGRKTNVMFPQVQNK